MRRPDPADPSGLPSLTETLERLLVPLARLCVAHGVPFAQAEELFKRAFVRAARAAQPQGSRRDISRVSIATGINRREVTRLSGPEAARPPQRMSPATQVFTHWQSYPEYRTRRGRPRRLPRNGPAPSFESLAHSVTRDVHPRSLLDDLCRLGLARLSDDGEWVELVRDAVVPADDQERMLEFLAANVGDHLGAAVDNVLSGERRHVEQAFFSNTASAQSAQALRDLTREQWGVLMAALVPALESMIDADRDAGRPLDQRVRVGLYSFHEPLAVEHDDDTN